MNVRKIVITDVLFFPMNARAVFKLGTRLLAFVAIMTMVAAAGADVWDETADGGGDAGDFPNGTFQTQSSSTLYDVITGNNADGIDSFKITITDASIFFLQDQDPDDVSDTKGFLWDLNGNPVMACDDDPSGAFGSFNLGFGDENTHTGAVLGTPGTVSDGDQYVLSVGAFGDTALDAAGNRLFIDDGGDFSALTGPTGAGAFNSYTAGGAGNYEIHLSGCVFGKMDIGGEFVPPASFTVFRGVTISANLTDFEFSDDVRARFNPGLTINSAEAPLWLIFDANAPSAVDFQVESQAGTPGLTYTVEAWNWGNAAYDVVGVQGESFNSDTVENYPIVAADHIDGSGNVRSRVGWRKTGPTINFPWEDRIDQVGWNQ